MQGAPLNYAALLRALKLRLILRQHQNSAHFGEFIFFRNPYALQITQKILVIQHLLFKNNLFSLIFFAGAGVSSQPCSMPIPYVIYPRHRVSLSSANK